MESRMLILHRCERSLLLCSMHNDYLVLPHYPYQRLISESREIGFLTYIAVSDIKQPGLLLRVKITAFVFGVAKVNKLLFIHTCFGK